MKGKIIIASFCLGLLFVLGCKQKEISNDFFIDIYQYADDGIDYHHLRKITDKTEVEKIRAIITDANWLTGSIDIAGTPDYFFAFNLNNSTGEVKAVAHNMWINYEQQLITLVADSRFTHLGKNNSKILFELVIDKEFGN